MKTEIKFDHEWHVALNKNFSIGSGNDFPSWMYEAKRAALEVNRLQILFKMERENGLAKVHKQCSMSPEVALAENFLTCCLGTKCSECKFLKVIDSVEKVSPEEKDFMKAWTCVGHILQSCGEFKNSIDTSEGFVLTEDDKLYWQNVYDSLSRA